MQRCKLVRLAFLTAVIGILVIAAAGVAAGNGAPSVQWEKTYGGAQTDWFNDVGICSDGGYIVGGWTTSTGAGDQEGWAVRLTTAGNTLWDHTYGGVQDDIFDSLAICPGDQFIFAGWTESWGAGKIDAWVLRADSAGNELMNNAYGDVYDDDFSSIAGCQDGTYFLVGGTVGAQGWSSWALQFSTRLMGAWEQTYGGGWFNSVAACADGGKIMAGVTVDQGAGGYDGWVVKLNSNNEQQWGKTFGGVQQDQILEIETCPDGGYIMAGVTKSFGAGERDGWVVKLNADGQQEWSKTFGGAQNDTFYTIGLCPDGCYILAGYTESQGAGFEDGWAVKINANGDQEWSKTVGSSDDEWFYSVAVGTDGSYIFAGVTYSQGAGAGDGWVVKLAPPVTTTASTRAPGFGILLALIGICGVAYIVIRRKE